MPPKNPYKCRNCNRSFQTPDALLQHSSMVHPSSSARPSPSRQNLSAFKCGAPGCERSFPTREQLLQHGSTHAAPQTVNRPYRCDAPGCGRHFKDRGALLQHRNDTHGAQGSRPVTVPQQSATLLGSPQTLSFMNKPQNLDARDSSFTAIAGAQYNIIAPEPLVNSLRKQPTTTPPPPTPYLFIPDVLPEPISFSIELTRLEDMMDPIPEHSPVPLSVDLTPFDDLVGPSPTKHDLESQS